MLRISAVFVVICMVLIAGASGAVLYLAFGLSGAESTIVAVAVLTALAIYNAVSTRLRDRSDVSDQIADLSRSSGDLARQVAEVGRRLTTLEEKGNSAAETARAVTAPIATELSEIGTLVKQLAETVAAHDAVLTSGAPSAAQPVQPAEAASAQQFAAEASPAADGAPASGLSRDDMLAAIRSAIEAHRVDMHLQPIVTLP